MDDRTWLFVTVFTLSAAGGALLSAVGTKTGDVAGTWAVDVAKVKRSHWFLVLLLVGFLIWTYVSNRDLIAQVGGFGSIFDVTPGSYAAIEYKTLQDEMGISRSGSQFNATAIVFGALGYTLFVGNLSMLTGAMLVRTTGRWRYAFAPTLITAAVSFITLQRTSLFLGVLWFGIAYILFRGLVPKEPVARPSRAASTVGRFAIALIAVATLLIPLQARNASQTQNSTGWTSVFEYSTASLAGLNSRLSVSGEPAPPPMGQGKSGPQVGYGAYTFSGAAGVIRRLGVPLPRAPFAADYQRVYIYGNSVNTNTASMAFDAYMDLGWLGLVLIPGGIAWLAGIAQRRSARDPGWTAVTVLLLSALAWSFFVSAPVDDFRYTIIALVGMFVLRSIMMVVDSPSAALDEVPRLAPRRGRSLPPTL